MSEVPPHTDSKGALRGRKADFAALSAIAILPLILFGDLLVGSQDIVISYYSADVSQFFIRIREFAVTEVLQGRIPLWNPHLMSGTPFIGNWQSAVFYPLNAIYLVLPVGRAVNLDVTIHLFLLGAFMYLWARGRGVGALGAYFGATIVMFSGPVFLRVLAGHITLLAVMSWAPLLLAAVDQIFRRAEEKRPLLGWTLVGIGATAMQMLAGHPQTVFITAVTVAIYCLIRLPGASGRIKAVASLACIAVCPLLLAAVQLMPGFHTGNESIRMGGTDKDFATLFSLPPENLITFFSPAFFGDRVHLVYWGRWAFWDSSVFMGISGLALACFGALYGSPKVRRFAVFLAFFFLFVSMGRYTPVYDVLLNIPGFSMFRGPSKYLIPFILFGGLLAGIGVDCLLNRPRPDANKRLSLLVFGAGFPLLIGIFGILFSLGGYWENTRWRDMIRLHLPDGILSASWTTLGDSYFDWTAINAALGLLVALLTCLVLGTLLWFSARSRVAVYLIVILGITEVFVFACVYRFTFQLSDHQIPVLETLYADEPGDYRVLHIGTTDDVRNPRNHVMKVGKSGLWGYEPVFLARYGYLIAYAGGGGKEFMSRMSYHEAWGSDPLDMALENEYISLEIDTEEMTVQLSKLFDMLRCRYMIVPPGRDYAEEGVYENEGYLPRFLFLRDYLVLSNPFAILGTLTEDTFDPWKTVILQREPTPMPLPSSGPATGELEVLDSSTDHVSLSVTLDEPAILLITDSYSDGWKAHALPGSIQGEYDLLPANFSLKAIPLSAGEHMLRIEYMPSMVLLGVPISFNSALWLSIASAMAYLTAIGAWVVGARTRYKTKKDE